MNMMDAILAQLSELPLESLKQYCRQHPPTLDSCKWCHTAIVSTPWFAPSGTFHMAGGGWTHEATESSPCGHRYPYRFAEPKSEEPTLWI